MDDNRKDDSIDAFEEITKNEIGLDGFLKKNYEEFLEEMKLREADIEYPIFKKDAMLNRLNYCLPCENNQCKVLISNYRITEICMNNHLLTYEEAVLIRENDELRHYFIRSGVPVAALLRKFNL